MSEEFRHGHPLRSETLSRKVRSAEAESERQASSIDEALSRVDQLELALLSVEKPMPGARPQASGQPARIYLPARPLSNTELLGPSVVTSRVRSQNALATPISAVGETELIEPGRVFAGLSDKQVASFNSRVDPSYLTEYNEIVLPHVGEGPLTWRLYHSSGYHEYANITRSTVRRYEEPREFNGHVELTSESATGFEGQYVHCAGGIMARQTDWTDSGTLEASKTIEREDTIQIEGLNVWPSGQAFSGNWRLFVEGEEVGKDQYITTRAGSTLRVEMDISSSDAVSFVSLDLIRTER